MLQFDFLGARHGDSIVVRWGTDHLMLVDGGPDTVYKNTLRPHLLSLAERPGGTITLDVACVTHVDDDHIVGVLELLQELRRTRRDQLPELFRIKRLWHNSVEELVDQAEPGLTKAAQAVTDDARKNSVVGSSYNQGRTVRDDAVALGLSGNAPFNAVVTTGGTTQIDGLNVTILSPGQSAVDQLAAKWRAAGQRKDPSVIAQGFVDRSIPNLSSIAMHVRYASRTALLLGDARGDHVLAGLEQTSLTTAGGVVGVDVLQLPHHGSENNVEREFFERIRADHYVISADGVKHHHPGENTLRWLVESRAPTDEYTIHFTNEIPFAREFLESAYHGRSFAIGARLPSQRALAIALTD